MQDQQNRKTIYEYCSFSSLLMSSRHILGLFMFAIICCFMHTVSVHARTATVACDRIALDSWGVDTWQDRNAGSPDVFRGTNTADGHYYNIAGASWDNGDGTYLRGTLVAFSKISDVPPGGGHAAFPNNGQCGTLWIKAHAWNHLDPSTTVEIGYTASNHPNLGTFTWFLNGENPNWTNTIYANWYSVTINIPTYNVAYNLNGGAGTTPGTQVVDQGSACNLAGAAGSRTGYRFAGWSINGATYGAGAYYVPTGNVTAYAVWTANTYTIAYNGNGATGGSTAATGHTYGVAANLRANGFTKTGYSFAGWATSSGGGVAYGNSQSVANLTATHGATVTLYAKWTANKYTVTLNQQSGSGGTTSVSATYAAGMPAITKPSRTGYTFGGYYTSTGGGGTQYYTATGASARNWDKAAATTLYAKWTANKYTVTLNQQSGSGGTTSVSATYASGMPAITKPSRAGYDFGGYYTSTGGGGTQYYTATGASARNWDKAAATTLYAKWTARTDTPYKVRHWKQGIGTNGELHNSDNYALTDTDSLKGTTDTSITPARKSYTGFTAPAGQSVNIDGNGSRVVDYYYTRNIYNVMCTDIDSGSGAELASRDFRIYEYGDTAKGSDWGTDATPSAYNRGYRYIDNSSITVPANNDGVVHRYFEWVSPSFIMQPTDADTDWSVGITFTAEVSNVTKTRWQKAHADADGSCKDDWIDLPDTEETWSFPDTNNTTTYTVTEDDAKNKYMYYRVKAIGDVDE